MTVNHEKDTTTQNQTTQNHTTNKARYKIIFSQCLMKVNCRRKGNPDGMRDSIC